MRRALIFAKRNITEIFRDPISYIFCLAMPLLLLAFMYGVFYDPQTSYWFSLDLLTPGIMTFSYSFTMLYMALLVSKDRTTAFLTRLFTSPMTTVDFVIGYTLPGLILSLVEAFICGFEGLIIGWIAHTPLNVGGMLLCILSQLPIMFMFIGFGILFGTIFNDKAAPGICSAIISACGMFSGAWLPIEMYRQSAKGFYIFCKILPFYPSTLSGRLALGLSENTQAAFTATGFGYENGALWIGIATALAYALVVYIGSICAFVGRFKSDKK